MGLWNRLFGARNPPAGPTSLGHRLLGDGLALHAQADDLVVGGTRMGIWTFWTVGLATRGQREIAISVARQATDEFPAVAQQAGQLLQVLGRLTREVGTVGASECTLWRDPGFRGARGLFYLDGDASIRLPVDDFLHGVPLFGAEAEAVLALGVPRLAARLGERFRWYPCPFWWPAERGPVAPLPGDDQTVLRGLQRSNQPRLGVWIESESLDSGAGCLVLQVAQETPAQLLTALREAPPEASFVLLPRYAPRAAYASVAWLPQQRVRVAIGLEPAKARSWGMAFLALSTTADEDRWMPVEDGVFLFLRSASWARLRDALERGEELELPTANRASVRLARRRSVFVSPIDGRRYPGDWDVFQPQAAGCPEGSPRGTTGGWEPGPLALLAPERCLPAHSDLGSFAALLGSIETAIAEQLTSGDADTVHVRLRFEPGAPVCVSACSSPRVPPGPRPSRHGAGEAPSWVTAAFEVELELRRVRSQPAGPKA